MSLFPTLGGRQLVVLLCAAMVDVVTANAGTLTVTTTADAGTGSLRDAVAAASDGDTIQFDAALNGQTIILTSNELAIEIYGVGPSLAGSGVSGVLADPTLELRDSNGVLIESNDNCGAISTHPLDPEEACIEISLPPGAFTAILAGKNGGTGIGLVEIYNVH